MELPVVIEPLPEGRGYTARLAVPFDLSVEAGTPEEAHQRLAALLRLRLQQGIELRSLTVQVLGRSAVEPGWLPDDQLTRDWLQIVSDYRAECDAADRQRFLDDPDLREQE